MPVTCFFRFACRISNAPVNFSILEVFSSTASPKSSICDCKSSILSWNSAIASCNAVSTSPILILFSSIFPSKIFRESLMVSTEFFRLTMSFKALVIFSSVVFLYFSNFSLNSSSFSFNFWISFQRSSISPSRSSRNC